MSPQPPASAPTFLSAVREIAADVKLSHSVFALPFALLAAFVAVTTTGSIVWSRFGGQLILVVLAMFLARTFAMMANRILDREIDAQNPRTAGRSLPSGRLSLRAALTALVGCGVLFVASCAVFGLAYGNWWPLALAIPVLTWIGTYGLLKRWTVLCHLWLGASLAISPLAAGLAVAPSSLGEPALWLLGLMVLCWVTGFDVIYALQDVDVDRREGLHSIPAALGPRGAIWVSRLLHVVAAGALVGVVLVDPRLGGLFATGVALVLGLLVYEHLTVHRWGTQRIALTFFTLNGVISCVLGAAGIADLLLV